MEKCLSCDEVAMRYDVKKITVWAWIREKKLNALKIGKLYRIRPEDLREFEASRTTKKAR
ncbi:MAG: binding domain, excisionase family [Firmicutes bacterium]|nr:binding domain, excisionase family [Bacillota bacterium]